MEFEAVYEKHFQAVYRFLLSLCRDRHVAEELSQETFFRAMRNWQAYQGRCAPDTWLCSIAKNAYFSYCRRQKRVVSGDIDALSAGEADDAGDALEKREQMDEALRALHGLREPYKEVFTLRVFAALDYAQIAALFGKSESWARVTYYRAKGMVQDEMRRKEAP